MPATKQNSQKTVLPIRKQKLSHSIQPTFNRKALYRMLSIRKQESLVFTYHTEPALSVSLESLLEMQNTGPMPGLLD
jgi:hypothetical protein